MFNLLDPDNPCVGPDNSSQGKKDRAVKLAKIHGPFARFLPEGDGGDESSGEGETSVVNVDGTFTEKWTEKYDEKDRETLGRYKKFDDLVSSHMSLRKKLGVNVDSMIQLPKDNSSDEVKAAFHKARGVPDTVEGYKFDKAVDTPPKVEVSDAQITGFADISKKHNLTNKQFNGVVNDYLKMVGTDIDAFEIQDAEAKASATAEGNQVLTQAFKDEAPSRKVRANALLDKYGLETIKMPDGSEASIKGMLFEENPQLLSSPWMIMFLDKVAGSLSEDTLKGITSSSTPSGMQIKEKIAELRAHPAYLDRSHPQHKDIMRQKTELYKKMPA